MKLLVSKDNHYMVAGVITSQGVVYSEVGEKQTPKAKFSIAIGNKEYVNCVAWNSFAKYMKTAVDGDNIFVVGKIEQREYNDKIYEDLYCDVVVLTKKIVNEISAQSVEVEGFVAVDVDKDLPWAK